MQLTREQAIAEHRKMWNWIAEQIETLESTLDIWGYKKEYCSINDCYGISNWCFLCEYAERKSDSYVCRSCPLLWGESEDTCMITENGFGLFDKCVGCEDWQEQAELARQIANLPERTDV